MKKIFSLMLMLAIHQLLISQNVGIGTATPNTSAQLDITSTTKGLLAPRMNSANRIAIITPARGLLVFDTGTNSFWAFNGTIWVEIYTSLTGWGISGNSNTNPATDFIGTTDNNDFVIKRNNVHAGLLAEFNSSYGVGSLNPLSTGNYNTAIGRNTLAVNTTGNFNTAIGYYTLRLNTNGNNNTSTGSHALYSNTIGDDNTAVGVQALYSNATGNKNTASGFQALRTNSGGNNNTAVGYYSLHQNTTGSYNTATGFYSLYNNTGGNSNTANGKEALFSNTTGHENTGNGSEALYNNTEGFENTANGTQALFNNTTGAGNVANGVGSLLNNSTGDGNTAIGADALNTNLTGNSNTALGSGSDISSGNLTNASAIGAGAIVNSNYKIRIGNSSIAIIEGQVNWSVPSDKRFKKNIKANVPGLDFINKLNPVTYNFDTEEFDMHLMQNMPDSVRIKRIKANNYNASSQITRTGFIAQEIEKICKEIGYSFDGLHVGDPGNKTDNYSLSYSQFIIPVVKAIQEQQLIIENLLKRIEKLEALIK